MAIQNDSATFYQTVVIPYLGVGTSSPEGCFHVAGYKATATGSLFTGGGGVQLGRDPGTDAVGMELCSFSTGSATGNNSYIDFTKPGTDYWGRILYGHDNNSFLISTNKAERVRITSAGYLGIGTTVPSAPLSVNGTAGTTFGQGFHAGMDPTVTTTC
jgi:hypothetical protein